MAIVVDGSVWGVLNIEAVEPEALGEAEAVLVEAIAASFGSAVHRAELISDIEQAFTNTLAIVTSTVEAKDDYTACHGSDVATLAERVALRMGLSAKQAREVHYAAMLHDVGKIAVPSEILCKEGPLTEDEWVVMRSHTVVGAELVERIDSLLPPGAGGALQPRAHRWQGLPRRPGGRADPAGGADHGGMRHLRRDRHRPSLPCRAHSRAGARGAVEGERHAAGRARGARAAGRAGCELLFRTVVRYAPTRPDGACTAPGQRRMRRCLPKYYWGERL